MKKRLSIVLLLLLSMLLSGCVVRQDVAKERYTGESNDGMFLPQEELIHTTLTPRETQILSQMTKVLENEYISLSLGKYYDIAVLDKRTGKLFLSGDAMYNQEGNLTGSSSLLKYAATQIGVDYYDRSDVFNTKTSYPECYQEEAIKQIDLEILDNAVRVTYSLGLRNDQFVLAPVLTNSAFLAYKKQAEKLVEEGIVTKTASGNFVHAYKKVTYTTVNDADKESYSGAYKNLPELGAIYVLAPDQTDKTKLNATVVSIALGIDQQVIEEQKEIIGFENENLDSLFYNNETDYFVVPVLYELDKADLKVSIETDKIEYAAGIYPVQFHLLNTFGAVPTAEDGYIFLPDGSGMIIKTDTSVYGITQLQLPFYGHDFGVSYDSFSQLPAYASMPVMGIKGETAAVFAIVESAYAMGGTIGRAGIATLPYACVYPYMNYFTRDYLNRTSNVYSYSRVLPTQDFTVRYHFLYGEDANYSGMARYYRQYLMAERALEPLANNQEMTLNLRLMGAINKTVRTLGIPNKQVIATTTFDEAKAIVETLHASGIGRIDVIYTEIMNGAREYKAPAVIQIQKELGGSQAYNDFVATAEAMGDRVYPAVDIGKVYKRGNTITGNDDVIGRISGDTAVIHDGITVPDNTIVASFVNPERYDALAQALAVSYRKQLAGNGMYLPTIGYYLSGNYNEKYALSRNESMLLTVQALKDIVAENGFKAKLEGGNVYTLPYADSLIYTELDSSGSRLETYSVPFTAIVLKGCVRFAGVPINNSGDYTHEFLKMIENGADPFYEIMAADSSILTNTDYSDMYSVEAAIWLDEIAETWKTLHESGYAALANVPILKHVCIAADVFLTQYENGKKVIVNYSSAPYAAEGVTIAPNNFAVIGETRE